MVETALVLPIFFLLVFGLIEMACLGLTSQVLTSAAYSACRVAVISNQSQDNVTETVQGVLTSAGISSSSYTLVTTPADVTTAKFGDPVTVTISVPFNSVSWITPSFLGSALITSSATLSSERVYNPQ